MAGSREMQPQEGLETQPDQISGDVSVLRHAIGSLVLAFAEVEHNLCHATGILIGSEETVGQLIVSRLPFKNLVDLYCTLIQVRAPFAVTPGDARELSRQLFELEDFRNRMLHSFWFPDVSVEEGEGQITQHTGVHIRLKMRSQTRKRTKPEVEIVEPTVIEARAEKAYKLGWKLLDILPPMPKTLRSRRRRPLHWESQASAR